MRKIWSRSNLSRRDAFKKRLRLGMPRGQLLEGIRLYVKGVYLASIEDDVATESGLEDIVSIEDFGAKLAESKLRDTLSRGGQVHKY